MAASVTEFFRSVLTEFPNEVGKEEYSITHLAENSRQKFVKVPTDQIYKETTLSRVNFLNNYKIKTLERSVHLESKQSDICLLTRDEIRRHQSKYNFLHIGLVQVYFVPFYSRWMEARFVVCLRDTKYPNFKDSILAAFEFSMSKDDIKFNWFPNFSSSLSDLANSNGLVITVEPHGLEMRKGSYLFGVTNRMCYKLMKKSLEPKSLFENPVLEVNTEQVQVIVPKPSIGIESSANFRE